MTAGTVGRTGKGTVINLGTAPGGRLVARTAVGCGSNVRGGFASGRAAVVASGAVGGRCKGTVINFGASP